MRHKHSLIHQTGPYLSLVALLGAQTRSSGVKLLGNDAQELSLVLGSVAVRRADVHHLEEERHTCVQREIQKRERDRDSVSVGRTEESPEDNKQQRRGHRQPVQIGLFLTGGC